MHENDACRMSDRSRDAADQATIPLPLGTDTSSKQDENKKAGVLLTGQNVC